MRVVATVSGDVVRDRKRSVGSSYRREQSQLSVTTCRGSSRQDGVGLTVRWLSCVSVERLAEAQVWGGNTLVLKQISCVVVGST